MKSLIKTSCTSRGLSSETQRRLYGAGRSKTGKNRRDAIRKLSFFNHPWVSEDARGPTVLTIRSTAGENSYVLSIYLRDDFRIIVKSIKYNLAWCRSFFFHVDSDFWLEKLNVGLKLFVLYNLKKKYSDHKGTKMLTVYTKKLLFYSEKTRKQNGVHYWSNAFTGWIVTQVLPCNAVVIFVTRSIFS